MTEKKYRGRAIRVAEWPEADQRLWAAARTEEFDMLDEHRPAANWRASSVDLYCRCYGLWLAWLKSEGLLDPKSEPASRVSKARLTAYLQTLRGQGCVAKTLANHAVSLRHMFEALTPDQNWRWMLPMIGKLTAAAKPIRNHADLPPIREMFELGLLLMRRADAAEGRPLRERAILFRNGLAIAMLAARPLMRRANLAAIVIGEHLVKEGSVYCLRFSAKDMKGGRRRGGPLPRLFTGAIDRYTAFYRPRLIAAKRTPDGADVKDILFVSGMGNAIAPHNMSEEIGNITEAVFGRRICTHEFRHAAGSSVAKEAPKSVGIVPAILGHADYRTSETYYIFADEHAAFRSFDTALDKLMREGEGTDQS